MKLARLLLVMFFAGTVTASAQEALDGVVPFEAIAPARVFPVRAPCAGEECRDSHAIVFIHGIYGSRETFATPTFDWPKSIPERIDGKRVDVYLVEYQTQLVAWAKKNVSNLDEVVYAVFRGMNSEVLRRDYKSIGLVGHSLGGNVGTSYLHTVKSELGHAARSRHSFIVTLGTPTDGADIAAVAQLIKRYLQMSDPLLTSLQKDNTFLRMLALWRYSENQKSNTFGCRPVRIYAGIEGSRYFGVKVVSEQSARFISQYGGAGSIKFETFPLLNHSTIAKPPNANDKGVYDWTLKIFEDEIKRVSGWRNRSGNEDLCDRVL